MAISSISTALVQVAQPLYLRRWGGLSTGARSNRISQRLRESAPTIALASAGASQTPLPQTGLRMTEVLHQLLTRCGVSGRYILVGHLLGGLIARLFRQAHLNDV